MNDSILSIQPEVCYSTEHFQVRLWTVPAKSHAISSRLSQNRSHCFLIEGQIEAITRIKEREHFKTLPKGQHTVIQGAEIGFRNSTHKTAYLLEICEPDTFDHKKVCVPSTLLPSSAFTEQRPWGSFTVLKDESIYKLKQLCVKPGNRLSLQRHQHREEHWLVIQGNPEVIVGKQSYRLKAGDFIHIPKYSWHRLSNLIPTDTESSNASKQTPSMGPQPVEVIELQLGDYFGEDDIERASDDYGRLHQSDSLKIVDDMGHAAG